MTTVDDLTYFGNSKFGTNSGVNEIGSLVQLLISVSVLGHIMSNPAAILNDWSIVLTSAICLMKIPFISTGTCVAPQSFTKRSIGGMS